jgi:hypothetical protein
LEQRKVKMLFGNIFLAPLFSEKRGEQFLGTFSGTFCSASGGVNACSFVGRFLARESHENSRKVELLVETISQF